MNLLILTLLLLKPLGIMNALRLAIEEHPYMALAGVLVLCWAAFNFIVQCVPEPEAKDGRWYRGFYRALHVSAFNFQYALRKKFPDYIPPDEKAGGQ